MLPHVQFTRVQKCKQPDLKYMEFQTHFVQRKPYPTDIRFHIIGRLKIAPSIKEHQQKYITINLAYDLTCSLAKTDSRR